MFFDWQRFCRTYNLHYVDRGPNTARGHISIQCPFCGNQDPSQHMGLCLDPRDPKWGCLRNPDHRGRSPVYLIRRLLNCSEEHAQHLVNSSAPELDEFEKVASELSHPKKVNIDAVKAPELLGLEWPPEIRELTQHGYGLHFLNYMRGRGFEPAIPVSERFGLRYALTGRWQWRVVIPFMHEGVVLGWTGRAINKASLRYLTLPSDKETANKWDVPQALTDPEEYVWRQDLVQRGGELLIIEEGPLDVLKTDWFKPDPSIVVTCVFGMPKGKQILLLANAARKYDRVIIILDRDAFGVANAMAQQIEELSGTRTVALEPSSKDPGAMDRNGIVSLIERGLD